MKKLTLLVITLAALLSSGTACVAEPVVKTGVEVLRDRGFEGLVGRKVGLVTNPSGVDRNLNSTIDILYNAPGVELVALYGPEHGVRGDVYAGGKVSDSVDEATGLPVYSIYGSTRKPTPQMLEGIDVMVYDIQDVGARSYTFISSLGLVMEACAEKFGLPRRCSSSLLIPMVPFLALERVFFKRSTWAKRLSIKCKIGYRQ